MSVEDKALLERAARALERRGELPGWEYSWLRYSAQAHEDREHLM